MENEKNIVDSKKYKESRDKLKRYFNPFHKHLNRSLLFWKKDYFKNPHNMQKHRSESGNYTLLIQSYSTKKGCWNYTRGIVGNREGIIIADIKRNYTSFPFLFIQHPNGKEYLICGEDYQGYTIINLTDKLIKTYIPEGWLKGTGFCWIDYKFNEEDKQLIVNGCYWACEYETVTYDFSNPDTIPLKELSRKDME